MVVVRKPAKPLSLSLVPTIPQYFPTNCLPSVSHILPCSSHPDPCLPLGCFQFTFVTKTFLEILSSFVLQTYPYHLNTTNINARKPNDLVAEHTPYSSTYMSFIQSVRHSLSSVHRSLPCNTSARLLKAFTIERSLTRILRLILRYFNGFFKLSLKFTI